MAAAAAALWLAANWVHAQEAGYEAEALRVTDLAGELRVEVVGSGRIEVDLAGPARVLREIEITMAGDTLVIDQDRGAANWIREWFGFGRQEARVTVRVPRGTPVTVDDFAGELHIGDTDAPLEVSGAVTEGEIGDVTEADLAFAGSSDIKVGRVAGTLVLKLSGSVNAEVESAGETRVAVSGSAEVRFEDIAGGFDLVVSGSAEVSAASVNGRVSVDISGSGDVQIGEGRADPLLVRVAGSGVFGFGGLAVDPDLSVTGAGDIWIARHEGNLVSRGANIRIGN